MSELPELSNRSNQDNLEIVTKNVKLLNRSSQTFAKSLLEAIDNRGSLSEKQWGWMDVLATRIISAAVSYGKFNNKCVFCRRNLTNPQSTEVGYGPICAERQHLPWG